MDRFRDTPPPPPGGPPPTGNAGVLVFVVEPDPPRVPRRQTPPPPPGVGSQMAPALALRRHEPLPQGIHRIGTGLLDRAIAGMSMPDRARAVQEACQAIEQARALLRLVRPATGERVFRFEDQELSEALQLVVPFRDDRRLVPALDSLLERFVDRLAPDAFELMHRQLEDRQVSAGDEYIAGALEILVAARARYVGFGLSAFDDHFSTVEPGLHATYSAGRDRMIDAYRMASDVAFGRWLAEVGHLRDQASMLDPDWATLGLSQRLRKLAMSLAEARDLAALVARVSDTALGEDDEERQLLRLLVIGQCQDIYRQLLPVGEKLYGDDPADFVERFGAYWRGWRSH